MSESDDERDWGEGESVDEPEPSTDDVDAEAVGGDEPWTDPGSAD